MYCAGMYQLFDNFNFKFLISILVVYITVNNIDFSYQITNRNSFYPVKTVLITKTEDVLF